MTCVNRRIALNIDIPVKAGIHFDVDPSCRSEIDMVAALRSPLRDPPLAFLRAARFFGQRRHDGAFGR